MKQILNILIFLLVLAPVGEVCADELVTVADGTQYTQAQMDSLRQTDDFVKASLVIAEPGDVLYAAFGHAGLHLQCPTFDLDYYFTYESESISDNWGRFLTNQLKMGAIAMEPEAFLEPYRESGRGVLEYELFLSPKCKQRLWQILDEQVAKGHNLPYDYFNRGCALSVVHWINASLGNQKIDYAVWPEKFNGTLRELGYDAVSEANVPWNRFALMTMAGVEIDDPNRPIEEKLIVPKDLVSIWQKAMIDEHLLLSATSQVLVTPASSPQRTLLTPFFVAVLLGILMLISLGIMLWDKKWLRVLSFCVNAVVLTIATLLGLLLLYLVFLSDLPCTSWNWLLIPFCPLPIVCWHWRKYWALPYAAILTIWIICIALWPHRLVEPAHWALVLSMVVMYMKITKLQNNKQLTN